MTKKNLLSVFAAFSVHLISCGTAAGMAQSADEALSILQKNVADTIVEEMNAAATRQEESAASQGTGGEADAEPAGDPIPDTGRADNGEESGGFETGAETAGDSDTEEKDSEDFTAAALPTTDNEDGTDDFNEDAGNAGADSTGISNSAEESAENTDDSASDTDKSDAEAAGGDSRDDEIPSDAADEESQNISEEPAPGDGEPPIEKVSAEDSVLNRGHENAPTADEREKVTEYQVFEEPETIVIDLPDANPPITDDDWTEDTGKADDTAGATAESPAPAQTETPQEDAAQPTENDLQALQNPAAPAQSENAAGDENPAQGGQPRQSGQVTPSRSVTVKVNQYLDVAYPGKGWTYIGESEKRALLSYSGRKLSQTATTFSLRARKAGDTVLHFYKNDALTGEYIDDYLAVKVEPDRSAGRVKAPAYADIVPAKPQRRIERANHGGQEYAGPAADKKSGGAGTQKTDIKTENAAQRQSERTPPSPQAQAEPNKTDSAQGRLSQPFPRPIQGVTLQDTGSDIKTVIQTTDSAAQSVATAAQTAQRQGQNAAAQSYNQIPTSSESTKSQETTDTQTEPPAGDEPWKQDGAKDAAQNADESLLEKARRDFVEGRFADALKEAQEYYNSADTRLDEALFLIGQISESSSGVRDIRFAVESYDMLVKRFPSSKLWREAKNRSVYLRRFYIDIR